MIDGGSGGGDIHGTLPPSFDPAIAAAREAGEAARWAALEAAADAQVKRGAALASDDYKAAVRHEEALGAALEALRAAERASPTRPVGWCETELAAAKAASVVGTAKRCAALKTAIDAHAAKLTAMRTGNAVTAVKHEQDYASAVALVSTFPLSLPRFSHYGLAAALTEPQTY